MIPQNGVLTFSRSRLRHNLEVIRQQVGLNKQICPVIKANAYGHGSGFVMQEMLDQGIKWFAYYSMDEAISPGFLSNETSAIYEKYRPAILTLAPLVIPDSHANAHDSGLALGGHAAPFPFVPGVLRVNVVDAGSAIMLDKFASFRGVAKIPVHMQIETGLTRVGVAPGEAEKLAHLITGMQNLSLEGLFTHLSHSEIPGHAAVLEQMAKFHQVADPIKKCYPHLILHAQNSGGTFNLAATSLDMVRVGIALYGLQPSTQNPIPELQPIAQLTAHILAIHERAAGTGVGYGHTFVTSRASRLAIVPVGYADGYPRELSNRGVVQVRGQNAPVVGRVSMDQIVVDVTDVPGAAVGDVVVVMSDDPAAENCVDRIAQCVGTIGYEITTGWGARLRRLLA